MADKSASAAKEAVRVAIDLSVSASTTGFSVSLKIDNTILVGIVSVGALSLGAFYLANRRPVENALRNGLEIRNEAGVVDPEVRNIEEGSIVVELHCHSEHSFIQFVEDFKAEKVKQRLEGEFAKIGFQTKLRLTIRNADEVYRKIKVIRLSHKESGTEKWEDDISQKILDFEGNPHLKILVQPKQRGFRFRYPCEGTSSAGLLGQNSEKDKKLYPSVRLFNYKGPARVVVSLVTVDEPPMPHAHSLIGKNSANGVVTVQIGPEHGMTASFSNLVIQHVTKKTMNKVLMDRYMEMETLNQATVTATKADSQGVDVKVSDDQAMKDSERYTIDRNMTEPVTTAELEAPRRLQQMVEKQKQNMNLNAVRLRFQAYLPDESGCFSKALPPCISHPVYDSKAPSSSQLKICRMHRQTGCVTGSDEIYLLCDKVQKDNIEVVFYETDLETGKRVWEERAHFSPTDVHRQVAIVFKTPPYWNPAINKPVNVQLELRRKSDGDTSEPLQFTYKPKTDARIGYKRRKTIPYFSETLGGGRETDPRWMSRAGVGGFGDFLGSLDAFKETGRGKP